MASLRNIMNVDDDHVDQYSPTTNRHDTASSRMHQHHQPTSSGSGSYPPPPDISMHSSSGAHSSRRTSQYSIYSQGQEVASHMHHGSSMVSSPGRHGRSSGELMDYDYSQGPMYGQQSPYSTSPMRSNNAPTSPGAEMPVKLTPITGRVSRAKKGVPVHTCDLCRPPKTFTRAEHLRRHQLSHQPADLSCPVPGCNKVFHRKDLLERHQQRHEQDDKMFMSTHQSMGPSSASGRDYSNSPQNTQISMSSYGNMNSVSGPYSSSSSTGGSNGWMAPGSSLGSITAGSDGRNQSRIHDTPRHQHLTAVQNGYALTTATESSNNQLPEATDLQQRSRQSVTTMTTTTDSSRDLAVKDGDQSTNPWQESPAISSESGSLYSTPSDGSHGPQPTSRSSSADWESRQDIPPQAFSSSVPQIERMIMHHDTHEFIPKGMDATSGYYGPGTSALPNFLSYTDEGIRESFLDAPPIPVQSMTFPSSPGLRSDTSIAQVVVPVKSERMMHSSTCVPVPLNRGLQTMFNFAEPQTTSLKQTIRDLIPVYLDIYWEKVNVLYPIIHRPTFEGMNSKADSEPLDILHCTMAAVATQFLAHETHRINGNHLHAYVAQKLKMVYSSAIPDTRQMTDRDLQKFQLQDWSLNILQATLLFEYYSRFRGRDKDSYKTSQYFVAVYFKLTHDESEEASQPIPSPFSWENWIDRESRQRLMAACFLLDVHGMRYFEQRRTAMVELDYSKPKTLPVPLFSTTTQLWETATRDSWNQMLRLTEERITVGQVLQDDSMATHHYMSLSQFDASILLAAQTLQLIARPRPTRLDLISDASKFDVDRMKIATLFPGSAVAYAYLALHHAPLHVVLSVSGDSWVFNRKVLRAASFAQHQQQLAKWRDSGSAAVSAAFAARALRVFLDIFTTETTEDASAGSLSAAGGSPKLCVSNTIGREISDFWGLYVCALICWAYGHGHSTGRDGSVTQGPSRSSSLQWIYKASMLQPGQISHLPSRSNAQGAVGLAREQMEKECLGGRSILLADALGVLRKLEEGDTCKRF